MYYVSMLCNDPRCLVRSSLNYERGISLERGTLKVAHEVGIAEGHIRIAKVGVLEGDARRLRHALPGDQGLLPAAAVGGAELVIHGPDAEVANLGAGAIQRQVLRDGRPLPVARGRQAQDLGVAAGVGVVDPDHDALPVVAVAETRGGGVLGHVPIVVVLELEWMRT